MKIFNLLFSLIFLFSLWYPIAPAAQEIPITPELFDINPVGPTSSEVCGRCHVDIYNTWSTSMHFQSYSDPIFQAAVLEAQVKRGESIRQYCLNCHTPLIQINKDYELRRSVTMEGVSCDFCHSVTKVNVNDMDTPYEFNTGGQKYGPIKDAASPAHKTYYSELHKRSEFCAGCHQLINEHGVLIMGTYTEWSESPYADSDIHCQNCHMPIEFDLKVVKPEIKEVDHFVTAHRFQGGHSQINIENAATLLVNIRRRGSEANVLVDVTNGESGHKLPTGTPARKIELVVQLQDENGSVIGQSSKTYRKVLVDRDGHVLEDNASQILDAVGILSDNRIAPKETRREEFYFPIPEGVKKISATAELNYIFETPVLQKELMAIKMAQAADTYLISVTQPVTSYNTWIIFASIFGIAVLIAGIVLYLGIERRSPYAARKMLAVLPFENHGPPDDDYFADGLTDATAARLAGIQALGIISRQSALQYKKSEKNVQEIGKELNVDFILEGTVQRERPSDPTSKVRVIPQLIRVSDDTQLWADTYDVDMNDVFRVQSELAEQVAQSLDITLQKSERSALETKPTENLEAYEYYLRGNGYRARSALEEDVKTAIQMYEKAVELDPNFAAAYAAISYARIWLYWQFSRFDELPRAKEALDTAQQLEPDRAETHMAQGYYYYWGSRDYENALKHFRNVQKRQPSNSGVIEAIGYIQRRQGKWEKAVASIGKALDLDPYNHSSAVNLGRTFLRLRRYAEAERYLDRAISLAPDIPLYYIRKAILFLSWDGTTKRAQQALRDASSRVDTKHLAFSWSRVDAFNGNYEKAISRLELHTGTIRYHLYTAFYHQLMGQTTLSNEHYASAQSNLETAVLEQPENPFYLRELAIAYAGLGRMGDAIREGERAVELLPVTKDAFYGPDILENLAWIHLMNGDYDAAIDKLELLLSIPSRISVPLLQNDPRWELLRENSRFRKLLEKKK